MLLDKIAEANKKMLTKNIYPIMKKISSLKKIPCEFESKDGIHIRTEKFPKKEILEIAQLLKPWRKGPFYLFDIFIDSEWRSYKKWNLIAPHIDIANKDVADIGCNNGYYMFEMLKHSPSSITGFDPYALYRCQFEFINHFIDSDIKFEMLGIEHLGLYEKKFDTIFCMGVLYHRIDPISSLKSLASGLKSGGELILDTLIINRDDEMVLSPSKSYAKMSNVYFIPSIKALKGWCDRAGFVDIEVICTQKTTTDEQRKTQWIDTMSLEDFLDKNLDKTIEGYDGPLRGYFKMRRK